MSNSAPLILMEDITKVFRTQGVETRVLNGIDLEIHQGEYVSIVGPSGCGKSTMLSIMGLLDSPTGGVFCFDGRPVQTLSAGDRARLRNQEIGFVFQSFNLIGDLTIYENVEQPLTYLKVKSAERRQRVEEVLRRVGMLDQARRRPSQLSGGQQQRVAVARALVCRPRILLADEPTGNLDSANGFAIMEMLRELHRSGLTICMVTHDPRFVKMADRLVYMLDGRMVQREVLESRMALD
ncbi:MAG: ABC transporter ATP-binding protein [Blastocatellales bacterium]|nr:ABC transporter ATP-binding protein [Blastocatellales bacterium]